MRCRIVQSLWEPTPEIMNFLSDRIENSTREKIEKHYPGWVLNQALVTYCTILDSFLDSTLDAVFSTQSEGSIRSCGGKEYRPKKAGRPWNC